MKVLEQTRAFSNKESEFFEPSRRLRTQTRGGAPGPSIVTEAATHTTFGQRGISKRLWLALK